MEVVFDEYIFVEWFRIISTSMLYIYLMISLDVFGRSLRFIKNMLAPETAPETANETALDTASEKTPETDDDAFEDCFCLKQHLKQHLKQPLR